MDVNQRMLGLKSEIEAMELYRPRTEQEAAALIPEIDKAVAGYKAALVPWTIGTMSPYSVAQDLLLTAADGRISKVPAIWQFFREPEYLDELRRAVTRRVMRGASPYFNGMLDESAIPNALLTAGDYFEHYARLEAVRSRPVYTENDPFQNNPLEHPVGLYRMGLKPSGFRGVNDRETIFVDIPLQGGGLACYRDSAGEIELVHGWTDDCGHVYENIRPFPQRPRG